MESPEQSKSKKLKSEVNQEIPIQGIDNWNDRLDENLEPEDHNDTVADDKAKNYSEKLDSKGETDN
ncbi:hypothetical protein [Pedobacter sp. Leaf250]|uniref:hypothetical protein n=1 Tax=Pedobacter sp. Leaf250 TaxID=2876559 RepID=UPI001E64B08B|nr:hypothetical protein [Pedobacter sp. Leaf250]